MKHNYFDILLLIIFIFPFAVSAQIGIVDSAAQRKPKLVILGTYHFANPGRDVAKSTVDDVLKPQRQAEIQQLVSLLERYQPSKIAVECSPELQIQTTANYEKYVRGEYTLERGEIEQIGFRLGKILKHKTIYCADWNKYPIGDISNYDYSSFADKHPELKALLDKNRENLQKTVGEQDKKLMALSVTEQMKLINQPENLEKSHRRYFDYVRLGLGMSISGRITFHTGMGAI